VHKVSSRVLDEPTRIADTRGGEVGTDVLRIPFETGRNAVDVVARETREHQVGGMTH